MMKKIIRLSIPLLVLCSVIALVANLEAQRQPDWKVALNEYLNIGNGSPVWRVTSIDRSRKPENFLISMGIPVQNDWTWQIESLPYPPHEMYCVLLESTRITVGDADAEAKRQVVYVGYYTDEMWRAGWIVHEGPKSPFSPEISADLTTIGCDLGLK